MWMDKTTAGITFLEVHNCWRYRVCAGTGLEEGQHFWKDRTSGGKKTLK